MVAEEEEEVLESPVPATKPLAKSTTPLEPFEQKMQGIAEQATAPLEEQIMQLRSQVTALEARLAAKSEREESFFTTAEVASFAFDLEPTEIPMWLTIHFLPAVLHRCPLAHEIVTLDEEQWLRVKHQPAYIAATSWLARAVKAALLREKPHVKRFYNSLLEQPAVVTCGRALVLAIRAIPIFAVGAEQTIFLEALESKAYFVEGMAVVDAKLAASQLKRDFELLATQGIVGTSPIALLNKAIEKMPASLAAEAKELRTKIFTAQTLGQPIFSYEQLSALIAGHVSAATPTRPLALAAERKCVICGATGHDLKTCSAKCDTCHLNFCPGARGKACVVAAEQPPSGVRNALNLPLPEHLAQKLIKAHTEYHAKPAGPTASAAEAGSLLTSAVAYDAIVANVGAAHVGPYLHPH